MFAIPFGDIGFMFALAHSLILKSQPLQPLIASTIRLRLLVDHIMPKHNIHDFVIMSCF